MNFHDPMCPAFRMNHPDKDRSWNDWQCQCVLIDGVREETRQNAVKAVMSIPYTEIDGVPLVIRQEAIDHIERGCHAPAAGT